MQNLVHTSIGTIDIDKNVEGYICGEEPGVTLGREVIIKTCKTRVKITGEGGNKRIIEPFITTSCMNPDIKTIMPLTLRAVYDDNKLWHVVYVSSQYETVQLDLENNTMVITTEDFSPEIKKADCAECNNCGRC